MEVIVHSQHGHIPDSLRDLVTAKMQALGRYLSTISRIEVEIDKDGHSYLVRACVATAGPVFRSR